MSEGINLIDIYDKNLNFLLGAGASADLFPTLALNVKDDDGQAYTLESLATWLDQKKDEARHDYLFMHYYKTCIKIVQEYTPKDTDSAEQKAVLENYERFLETVLHVLQRRQPLDKRCNVFTTNYDGCLAQAADNILKRGTDEFVVNDGARGFRSRHLQAQNFNTYLCKTGVFERSQTSVPQVNLIHLHGSIFWKKDGRGILVNYLLEEAESLIKPPAIEPLLDQFSRDLMDATKSIDDIKVMPLAPPVREAFWDAYNKLPIVNPTKWKFHETVFEEHYYQMLRLLSYELEKPNAVLITFGFSFADEHILNLLMRSLANPSLQVYVCCHTPEQRDHLSTLFNAYKNVKCIALEEGKLNFQAFNNSVFTTATFTDPAPAVDMPGQEPEPQPDAGAGQNP
jgi:hypothetical protein